MSLLHVLIYVAESVVSALVWLLIGVAGRAVARRSLTRR